MSGKIFISYRRDDSAAIALGIGQYLAREFGLQKVLIDVDMRAGTTWKAALDNQLAECKVLLAVIGPNWLDACDDAGNRRLEDPEDWVRNEVASALDRKLTLVPVLIGGAKLPNRADLPKVLEGLVDHQSAVVTTNGFRNEMGGLARDIRAILNDHYRVWRWLAVVALVSVLGAPAVTAPEPELKAAGPERAPIKIDGTSTYDIVRQIRCETRRSVIDMLLGWLSSLNEGRDPIAAKFLAQYKLDAASIKTFQENLFKGPEYARARAFVKSFYGVGIAYEFDRKLTQMDTFGGLLTSVDEGFCTRFTSAKGAKGIDELLRDFTMLSLFASGKGPPAMVNDLKYVTGDGSTGKVTVALATGENGPAEKSALMAIQQFKSRYDQ
jgi:hypothetical protein